MLPPRIYDALKPVAQIWLPALGTLYFTVAAIWGLPAADQVVGTIVAVDTFLGVILGVSTAKFNDSDTVNGKYAGDLMVYKDPETGGAQLAVALNAPPHVALNQGEVVLKVNQMKQ
jgi:putative holin Dp-1